MKKKFLFLLPLLFACTAEAAICKKEFKVAIEMEDEWYRKETKRLIKEEFLLNKHSDYISQEAKQLIAQPYFCEKGETCDKVKNCQIEKNIGDIREMEYSIKTDRGIIIKKSYCSIIGKCIGYNDFLHTSQVTAAEDRLIDIIKDNAVFYHYFYSARSKAYEPPFNMTNFHTGSELYLDDEPHFSPDERVMIEVRSIPKNENNADAADNFPRGFNINIYEMNEFGEYKNVEPAERDAENKITSTFLSRNPTCGETPHFHSWKSNREIRLSMMPPEKANEGRKVILAYDKKTKKWGCQEELFPEMKCESYLPNSTKFTSNLANEQIENCR